MVSERASFLQFLLLGLGLLAACVPLWSGFGWDGGTSFDPRERELSQLSEMVQPSGSLGEYLDPDRSRSNLRRYEVESAAAYGSLLLLLPRIVPQSLSPVAGEMTRRGRVTSALFATGTICLTALLAALLFRSINAASFSALLLGGTVLQIRSAHYFLPEAGFTFAAALGALGTVLMVRDYDYAGAVLCGIAVALACAIDPHGVLLMPVVLLGWLNYSRATRDSSPRSVLADRALFALCGLVLVTVLGFRLLTPYAFTHIDGVALDREFVRTALSMLGIERWEADWRSLESQMLASDIGSVIGWGIGVPALLAIVTGALGGLAQVTPPLLLWVAVCISYSLLQPDSQLLLITAALPALAAIGGGGLACAVHCEKPILARSVGLALVLWAAVSGRPYASLFATDSTLLLASEWIDRNVPQSSRISTEQGDIRLPAAIGGRVPGPYRYLELRLFADNVELARRELSRTLPFTEFHVSSSQYPELLANRVAKREIGRWREATVAREFFASLASKETPLQIVASFAPADSLRTKIAQGRWEPLREAPGWLLRSLAPEVVIRRRVETLE